MHDSKKRKRKAAGTVSRGRGGEREAGGGKRVSRSNTRLSEALFPSSACLLLQVVLQGMKEAVDDNLSSPLVSDSEFGSCRYFTFPAFHFQEKYKGMTFLSRREENERRERETRSGSFNLLSPEEPKRG